MSLAPGTKLGPYEILAAIGEGGMGAVFRATDTRLHRTVAIKLVAGDRIADPSQRRRFLQEARAASALNHPNIVVLFDISNQDGMDFLVMEHVSGQTLKSLIPAGGMPIESVARLGAQIASALAAAHAAGIVHRDIKPANIMVTPDNQVKVLDFGVAKVNSPIAMNAGDETATVALNTIPGVVVGTVSYMSPEQTRGEPVDGSSDIFSLGCLLYQAVTGQLPFKGPSTLAVMHEIASATPPAPSSFRADVPVALDRLIAACLEKSPNSRPASATDVAIELTSLATPSARVTAPRPADRRPVAVIPFRLRTSLAEDQFLSVALADVVANRLSSIATLLVRPMATVMRYAGAEVEWTQVAREQNLDLVIEGTIQRIGPRVRIQVQVCDMGEMRAVHSFKQDGHMEDLFGLQDRLAEAVSEFFAPRSNESTQTTDTTQNPLAFELYLRAIDRATMTNKFDTGSAIEMLTRATDLDPHFSDAWARLAQSCVTMGTFFDPDPKWLDRAEQAIARALELDPGNGDALCARGQILWTPARHYQNRAAIRAVNGALKINPNCHQARQLRGLILYHLGFYGQAERDLNDYSAANPQSPLAFAARAQTNAYQGRYEAACELFLRALAIDPAQLHANLFFPETLLHLGRLAEGRERVRKARLMVPDEAQVTSLDGLLAAMEGDFVQAEQLADEAVAAQRSVLHTHHNWHTAAGIFARCGKPEKAILWLRRCAQEGLPNYRLFERDPHLQSLKGDPELTALLSDLRREHDQYAVDLGLTEATHTA